MSGKEDQKYVEIPETEGLKDVDLPSGSVLNLEDRLNEHEEVLRNLTGQLVTLTRNLSRQSEQTNWLKWLMGLMLGVLFVGFLTMLATLTGILTDTWRYNINSYIDYEQSVSKSIEKFDSLGTRLEQIGKQLQQLGDRLDNLELQVTSLQHSLKQ